MFQMLLALRWQQTTTHKWLFSKLRIFQCLQAFHTALWVTKQIFKPLPKKRFFFLLILLIVHLHGQTDFPLAVTSQLNLPTVSWLLISTNCYCASNRKTKSQPVVCHLSPIGWSCIFIWMFGVVSCWQGYFVQNRKYRCCQSLYVRDLGWLQMAVLISFKWQLSAVK